jgi:hypothetical protein
MSAFGDGASLASSVARAAIAVKPSASRHFVEKLLEQAAQAYAEARPDVVLLAKQMHDQGMSLRKISAELAARGYVTAGGKPYVASAVQTMLG